MIRYIKTGKAVQEKKEIDEKVVETVVAILADIEARGWEAIRDYSTKFDNWNPNAGLLVVRRTHRVGVETGSGIRVAFRINDRVEPSTRSFCIPIRLRQVTGRLPASGTCRRSAWSARYHRSRPSTGR